MAPRRRPRKRGTRMDAALDAMNPYGFGKKLVRETVEELLQVYTEDGWYFIEDGAYKVLIETILEKQEKLQAGQIEALAIDKRDGDDSHRLLAGPSSSVALPDLANKDIEAIVSASPVDETCLLDYPLVTREIDSRSSLLGSEAGQGGGRTISQTRRKPFYGWIGFENEATLVELEPGPLPEFLKSFLSRRDNQRKRKSRWDVKPEAL